MGHSDQRPASRDDPNPSTQRADELAMPPETTWWTNVSKRTVNDAAYVRLRSELTAAVPEFELLVERASAEGESWVVRGRDLLRMADEALDAGAIDAAWRHLHTAKRLEIYGLERLDERTREEDHPVDRNEGEEAGGEDVSESDADEGPVDPRSELQVRAAVVYEEALGALDGWRRRAVVDLLGDDEGALKDEVTGAELRAACRILDEYYEGIHLARSEQQRQFNQLVLMGILSGLSLFLLSVVDWMLGDPGTDLTVPLATFLETPFGTAETDVTAPGFAVFVTVAGVMGASLFGMRSLRNRSLSTKIPQQINQLTVTSARAVIGAISALVFYFALQAPLLWGGPDLMELPRVGAAMVVVGFAAGYNERMAPAVVAKVASITDTDSDESADAADRSHPTDMDGPASPVDPDERDPT